MLRKSTLRILEKIKLSSSTSNSVNPENKNTPIGFDPLTQISSFTIQPKSAPHLTLVESQELVRQFENQIYALKPLNEVLFHQLYLTPDIAKSLDLRCDFHVPDQPYGGPLVKELAYLSNHYFEHVRKQLKEILIEKNVGYHSADSCDQVKEPQPTFEPKEILNQLMDKSQKNYLSNPELEALKLCFNMLFYHLWMHFELVKGVIARKGLWILHENLPNIQAAQKQISDEMLLLTTLKNSIEAQKMQNTMGAFSEAALNSPRP